VAGQERMRRALFLSVLRSVRVRRDNGPELVVFICFSAKHTSHASTGVEGRGRQLVAAWPVASEQLSAAKTVLECRLQQNPPDVTAGFWLVLSSADAALVVDHGDRNFAIILRSGMTEPGMVKYVVDNLKEAMQYVMVCSPDRKTEVLKHFLEVMKPDAVDTASESAFEDRMMYHEQLQRAVRMCSMFRPLVNSGCAAKLSASPQTFPASPREAQTSAAKTPTTLRVLCFFSCIRQDGRLKVNVEDAIRWRHNKKTHVQTKACRHLPRPGERSRGAFCGWTTVESKRPGRLGCDVGRGRSLESLVVKVDAKRTPDPQSALSETHLCYVASIDARRMGSSQTRR
jgi:hypothetical protein